MIELQTVLQHLLMLGIAAFFGGVGGIAAELMAVRGKPQDTGALEIPRSLGTRYRDLGWLASVVLGAIAAPAALFFLAPTVETVREVAGQTATTTQYELFKLAGLSLIVGSAGSRFLASLQTRALAMAEGGRTDSAVATANAATAGLPKQAAALVRQQVAASATPAVTRAAEGEPREAVPEVGSLVSSIADTAAESVERTLAAQVETTQRMIAAAAGRSGPGNVDFE